MRFKGVRGTMKQGISMHWIKSHCTSGMVILTLSFMGLVGSEAQGAPSLRKMQLLLFFPCTFLGALQ